MNTIKILVAEDHTMVRKGFISLLQDTEGFEVVGEAADGREAVNLVKERRPDIVLMDISMPELNGIEATKQIKKAFPEISVLILTMHVNEAYIMEIIKAGASGYVLKRSAPEEMIMAIRAVREGEKFFSPRVSSKIIEHMMRDESSAPKVDSDIQLTSREIEILQLIAEKHTGKEIAAKLCISDKTVEVHRVNIMKKLDLHSVADLTKFAIQKGIIVIDDSNSLKRD